MPNLYTIHRRNIILLCFLLLILIVFIHVFNTAMTATISPTGTSLADAWPVRLLFNLISYSIILVPGYFITKHLKNSTYFKTAGHGWFNSLLRICVLGSSSSSSWSGSAPDQSQAPPTTSRDQTVGRRCLKLLVCVTGLQVSYLTWGVLQERIMKHDYGATYNSSSLLQLLIAPPPHPAPGGGTGGGERFTNTQFLVFMNRVLALVCACVAMTIVKVPEHRVPLYKYSYCSLSNILSSWCQYEALRFVSFPTQVLAKASKIIPVMLMGRLVSGKSYLLYEYITAALISLGVSTFLLTNSAATSIKHISPISDGGLWAGLSGVALLIGYLGADAFTSNWQARLFASVGKRPSSLQMMAGVNLCSALLTLVTLAAGRSLFDAFAFAVRHPAFGVHVALLSLCSASGQLFIFYTIGEFGAVTFTVITTLRQALAILLSCLLYGHVIGWRAAGGVLLVFAAILARIYCGATLKVKEKSETVVKDAHGVERNSALTDVVISKR